MVEHLDCSATVRHMRLDGVSVQCPVFFLAAWFVFDEGKARCFGASELEGRHAAKNSASSPPVRPLGDGGVNLE